MPIIMYRVDRRSIDDQKRRFVVFVKKARIRFRQTLQITPPDSLLVSDAAARDPEKQCVYWGLKIDDEIRRRRIV